ncbi:MAG: ROK family protein [Pseudomonadota bacterium]
MTQARPRFGCIEAGGTKFVLGIAEAHGAVLATTRIPTTNPADTIAAVIEWFKANGPVDAIGIASFGPIDPDPASPRWGFITKTTKPDWSGTDFAGRVGRAFDVPVGFDTDVNGAALAESRWGAAQGDDVAVYFTVGTGIGGGAIINGAPIHGAQHPEMGHILPRRHPDDLDFPGVCPFHGDCFEGLVSGPAIKARWGASLSELPADHPAHKIVAWYLGQLAMSVQAVLSPRRIIFGGGVMATPGLLEAMRSEALRLAKDYVTIIIEPPALGDQAGLLGGLALAQAAFTTGQKPWV